MLLGAFLFGESKHVRVACVFVCMGLSIQICPHIPTQYSLLTKDMAHVCALSLTRAHTHIQRGNTASHEKGLGVAHEFERIFGGLFSANRGKSYLMVMCLCVPCGNVFVCAREGGGGGGMAVVERARDRQAETEREHIMGMYLCIDMFVCVCVRVRISIMCRRSLSLSADLSVCLSIDQSTIYAHARTHARARAHTHVCIQTQ